MSAHKHIPVFKSTVRLMMSVPRKKLLIKLTGFHEPSYEYHATRAHLTLVTLSLLSSVILTCRSCELTRWKRH